MLKKHLTKVQYPFLIKTLHSAGIEGTFLNIIKAIYGKSTANIILNGEKLTAFPLRSGTRQGCPLSHPVVQHSTRSPSLRNQTTKRNKRNPNWQRSQILTLRRWHDIPCGELKKLHTQILEVIKEFSKVAGYKINAQKSVAFIYTNNKTEEREIKETSYP